MKSHREQRQVASTPVIRMVRIDPVSRSKRARLAAPEAKD
ncbi:hypothetical protein ABID19_002798 [Mesorhizobium robiniae]|uniref:Uncharacterized protein n=1 Tax=Mesorhizobium robiniae TaxID=559315 RepID=A0ABV2GNN8_9HYPH